MELRPHIHATYSTYSVGLFYSVAQIARGASGRISTPQVVLRRERSVRSEYNRAPLKEKKSQNKRRSIVKSSICTLIVVLTGSLAGAQTTYYVATTGSDSNPGTSAQP